MYSRAITEAPITVFLGAGASRSLGKLLMAEFITLLENNAELKEDLLFKRIIAKERDLEFLLGELEEWTNKSYYPLSLPQVFWAAGQRPEPTQFDLELSSLISRAEQIHQTVRRLVFRSYRIIEKPGQIESLFLPTFEAAFQLIQPLRYPLVVFTTNYDPAVEDLCEGASDRFDLVDGFLNDVAAKSWIWRREQFDHYQAPTSKKNIVLFKLHGSTNWTQTPKGLIRSPASIYTTDDAAHRNVLIYPARKKVASEEPFFTAYDYFQRCMEGCKVCLTVGYSFRDEDALTRLRSAARKNQELKVIVLDPSSAEIASKLRKLGVKAEPIGRRFEEAASNGDANLRSQIRDDFSAAIATVT